MSKETVTAAVTAPESSLRVRFVPVVGSKNAKAPAYRAMLYLAGALAGLVLEAPIFKDEKTGSFSVSVPGGRFAALKPANVVINVNGQDVETTQLDPNGSKKIDSWEPKILTAFHAYRQSVDAGKPVAEHQINFS